MHCLPSVFINVHLILRFYFFKNNLFHHIRFIFLKEFISVTLLCLPGTLQDICVEVNFNYIMNDTNCILTFAIVF